MTLLNAQALAKSYAGNSLFSDVSFSVLSGDAIALIGPNGSGKSTLLKILAGQVEPDSGHVTKLSGVRTSYIEQTETFEKAGTVEEILNEAAAAYELHGGGGIGEAMKLAGSAGFHDVTLTVENMSGGWRKRLNLLLGLLRPAEVYLLDEPTNHLDLAGVWWLENYLSRLSASFVVCSHDRYFLDRVSRRTVEINPIFPKGMFLSGKPYSLFLEHKNDFLAAELKRLDKQKNTLRRESEWARRSPKARGTKSKSRLDAAEELALEVAAAGERLDTAAVAIDFSGETRKSKRLIELQAVKKSFDDTVLFEDLDVLIAPGMRLGLLGINGSGKSSLLKILAERSSVDSGSVYVVQGVSIAYFDQERSLVQGDTLLKRFLAPDSDSVNFSGQSIHVTSWARRFGFSYAELDKPLSVLSGGQKAKAFIAHLMLQEADVLLLDEPTNDLDIATLELLEDALINSNKTVVLVSHDRYFLQAVCRQYLGFLSQGCVRPFASVEQWEREMKKQVLSNGGKESRQKKDEKQQGTQKKQKKRLSYNEQREYGSIEEKIVLAEAKVEQLERQLEDPAVLADALRLKEISLSLADAGSEVERLYGRWEYLASIADSS